MERVYSQLKNPIVLFPGWGLNAKIWTPFLRLFKDHIQLFPLDYPGFGKNINEPCPCKLETALNWLDPFIPTPCILLGWSLGGQLALKYATLFPKKVLGIITIASTPCFLEKSNWPGITRSTFNDFYQRCHDPQKLLRRFIGVINQPVLLPESTRSVLQIASFETPTTKSLQATLEWLETLDLRANLTQIKCPILQIFGQNDNLVPVKVATICSVPNPLIHKQVIINAGHHPFLTHTHVVFAHINDFLETIPFAIENGNCRV